jgi:hypothetical protein
MTSNLRLRRRGPGFPRAYATAWKSGPAFGARVTCIVVMCGAALIPHFPKFVVAGSTAFTLPK